MKNVFIGLMVTLLIVIVGCKKEIEPLNKSSEMSSFVFDPVIIDKEQSKLALAKIKAFKDRINSPSKDIEWYTEEEAQWLIDACSNYDFATISQAYPEYIKDTLIFLLPTTSEGISSEALESVYQQITDELESIKASINAGDEVEIQGIIVKFSTPSGVQDLISVDLFINMGFSPNETPFSAANNDYWYWGKGLGKVDGSMIGDDASTAITFRANQAIINFLDPGNYTYSDNQYLTVNASDVPFNNTYNSRIWNVGPVPLLPEQSLTPGEMNEFLNHALYVAQYYKPSGKLIKFIEVSWAQPMLYYSNGVQYYGKTHVLSIAYGVPNI
jgi:hypothetical protein